MKPNDKASPKIIQGRLMVALSVLAVSAAGTQRQAWGAALVCTPIDFGTFSPCPTTAGTVTVSPAGVTTPSPGCLTQLGAGKRAQCLLTGETGVRVITASSPITLNSGGNSMTVNAFLFSADTPPLGPVPTLTATVGSSSPVLNFYVGATLNINAAQAGGSYTGTYTITTNNP